VQDLHESVHLAGRFVLRPTLPISLVVIGRLAGGIILFELTWHS
jgi:hypothetical protein